jgi:hypothetical protein
MTAALVAKLSSLETWLIVAGSRAALERLWLLCSNKACLSLSNRDLEIRSTAYHNGTVGNFSRNPFTSNVANVINTLNQCA